MNLYSALVCLHVITAILGLGPLAALAILTTGTASDHLSLARVELILRVVIWGLVGMLLTGAGLIALTHGALGREGWVRVSFVLFLGLGFLHGMARRQLRRARRAATSAPLPKALNGFLWSMCGVVAVITFLMEAKP